MKKREKKRERMAVRLFLSGVSDVDCFILSLVPPVLAPLVRTVCSSWASAIPRYGLCAERDDNDYDPEDLALYLAEQGLFDALKWLSRCAAPFGDVRRFLGKLVVSGKPEHLEWALDVSNKFGPIIESVAWGVCGSMGIEGRCDLLEWALNRSEFGRPHMGEVISHWGCASIIPWVLEHNIPCSPRAYIAAIRKGDTDLLNSLREHKVPLPQGHYFGRDIALEFIAAQRGSMASLLWVHSALGPSFSGAAATAGAASGGHLKTLIWLEENNLLDAQNERACMLAAKSGHQEIVRWLHYDRGYPWSFATHAAVRGGHLGLFRWLCSEGCPYSMYRIAEIAVQRGHIQLIQWAINNGAAWPSHALCVAATKGHLEALRWCRAHGAVWDEHICSMVSHAGQNAVLRWLISEEGGARGLLCAGCVKQASYRGHTKTLKILFAAGCPATADAMHAVAMRGNFKVIKLLCEKGCPISEPDFCLLSSRASCKKEVAVLELLYTRGCPWTAEIYDEFVKYDPGVSAWAKSKGRPA